MPATLDITRPAAEEAATLLRTLGNPERLMLLCELTHGELFVSDLAARTGIGQPTLSQQLAVLREQQLVATRRDGKQVYYSIADPKAKAVLRTLHKLFCAER